MATARCTWTAVSGVDGYNVYLKSNGEFVKQNSELITETTYDIEGLEGGNYEAYATSVKDSLESGPSNVKLFEIDDPPYIEGAFAITVKTDNTGTSNDDQFTLTSGGSLGGANYRIDWYKKADPTVTGTITDASGAQTITFPEAGTYVVQVASPFNRISFANGGDRLKLLEINQWGAIAWSSMFNAFQGCSNIENAEPAIDAPDLSNVTNADGCFRGSSWNQDMSHWNWNTAGGVVNCDNILRDASSFNQNIGSMGLGVSSGFRWNRGFQNSGMSCENYTDTIVGWANSVHANNYPLNAAMFNQFNMTFATSRPGGANFADAGEARNFLDVDKGWTFTNDTVQTNC